MSDKFNHPGSSETSSNENIDFICLERRDCINRVACTPSSPESSTIEIAQLASVVPAPRTPPLIFPKALPKRPGESSPPPAPRNHQSSCMITTPPLTSTPSSSPVTPCKLTAIPLQSQSVVPSISPKCKNFSFKFK